MSARRQWLQRRTPARDSAGPALLRSAERGPTICPHARHRHDGSQSKIEQPWCRRRACGQHRSSRSCSQAPWWRPGRGRSAWARRSRHPAPRCRHPAGLGVAGSPSRSRRPLPWGAGLRWGNYRTLWLRGRPSPTRGHARPRRTRPCRVPTQLSCGPVPSPEGDHRIVALRSAGRARPQVREGKPSISQRAHRIGHPPSRPPRDRSARSAGSPTREPVVTPAGRGEAGSRASPTDRREPRSKIAPTPPTRAGLWAPGSHDPIQRLPTAASTTMNTRHFGSCSRRSGISVVHGRRRSHGQPRQRIMCATAERAAATHYRTERTK
jgi:hypothetical protein